MPNRETQQALTAAGVLSVIAGAWMLIGPTWMVNMHWDSMHDGSMMHSVRPWLWHHSFMGSWVPPLGWPWPGVVAGLAVLICGILLLTNPAQRVVWGVIILASSALILLTSMGGALPGVLGIVGGVLALAGGRGPAGSPPDETP
jgi:hypothetical protein